MVKSATSNLQHGPDVPSPKHKGRDRPTGVILTDQMQGNGLTQPLCRVRGFAVGSLIKSKVHCEPSTL